MTTHNDKTNWNDRLKTADNLFLHDILQNFGLSGGLSVRDLPYIPLTGLAAAGLRSKMLERKERRQEEGPSDIKKIDNFSNDMSNLRNVIERDNTNRPPSRNHPSNPDFVPDSHSPYGIYDYDTDSYVGGPPPLNNIIDIREHPRFNARGQGRDQRGRPFGREEE